MKSADPLADLEAMTSSPCDYKDGFHISFKGENSGRVGVLLTCPACHSRFKTPWVLDLSGSGGRMAVRSSGEPETSR
jgi:hypothetical protein